MPSADCNKEIQPIYAGKDAIVVRHLSSVTEVSRTDWNRLFSDSRDNWEYLSAIEQTKSNVFSYSALGAFSGESLIAVAPLFQLDYRFDKLLGNILRPLGNCLDRNFPRIIREPVLVVGSPTVDECPIGLHPALRINERTAVFEALIQGMRTHARCAKIELLALKDVTDFDAGWAGEVLNNAGFVRMASLPISILHLPFPNEDAYLASLPPKVRNDIRRKMRLSKDVTTEFRSSIEDIHDELILLYEETRAHRHASYEGFDDVPEGYFREVMRANSQAQMLLCRVNGELASFNLFLVGPNKVIGQSIGMRYELARKHNLFFVNWMTIVRFCLENRIAELQTGQTTYLLKQRLGCGLRRSWIYFKPKSNLVGPMVRRLAPRMGLDQTDPDLVALGEEAHYLPT